MTPKQNPHQGVRPAAGKTRKNELIVSAPKGSVLSPAQVEFNKLMKRLETMRKKHQREIHRLDALVTTCSKELLPLVDEIHRLNFGLVKEGISALKTLKLTTRRKASLANLLCAKAKQILCDSCGLTEDEVEQMNRAILELGAPVSSEDMDVRDMSEFEILRDTIQAAAREAGVDLNLSDLDLHGDPTEFASKLHERFSAAVSQSQNLPPSPQSRKRQPTKAQLEREKKQQEADEVKKRDLKSLYKQLAKVLHPDLETAPVRKLQKEEWMKRLTTAHAKGDLRELLYIELEWLGVEASNLTSATDEKLAVYCTVLKEQIAEMKLQTSVLVDQPQYAVLDRFRHPYFGHMSHPIEIEQGLLDEIDRLNEMLNLLKRSGGECTQMINRWADTHARSLGGDDYPF